MAVTPTPTPYPSHLEPPAPDPPMKRALVLVAPPEHARRQHATPPAEEIIHAINLNSALGQIHRLLHPLVLLHPQSVPSEDFELAKLVGDLPSRPLLGIIGDHDSMGAAFELARKLGIGCLIPDDALARASELSRLADWLESGGPETGLAPHLAPVSPIHRFAIRAKNDKAAAIEETLSFVRGIRSETKFLFELRLILEETINNAIFHAFHTDDGREKYSIGTFESLQEGEDVWLEYGADGPSIGIAVSDNQGRLKRDTILTKIQRQLSSEGLLDQNGRGLHLVYSLSRRLVFNLRPHKLAQVVALFPAVPGTWFRYASHHPLFISSHS